MKRIGSLLLGPVAALGCAAAERLAEPLGAYCRDDLPELIENARMRAMLSTIPTA